MRITVTSKPEKKTSSKGTVYFSFKAVGDDKLEKSGNYFSDNEPAIDQVLEVEERYNDQYKNYTWYDKKEKKGFGNFTPKPSMTIDQQIRVAALAEAIKITCAEFAPEASRKVSVLVMAHSFENFIKNGTPTT